MTDLRILWLGKEDKLRMQHVHWNFREEVARQAEVIRYGKGWQRDFKLDIPTLENEYSPDVILIEQIFGGNQGWKRMGERKAPAVMLTTDPHGASKVKLRWINNYKLEASLHRVRGRLPDGRFTRGIEKTYGPRVWDGHQCIFFPWSINVEMFKEYYEEREYDVALLGNVHRNTYGVRLQYYNLLSNPPWSEKFKFFYSPRPAQTRGVSIEGYRKRGFLVKEDYARAISNSQLFVLDSGMRGYPVGKYFEVMACNTMLLANTPADATELGFLPGWNFIELERVSRLEESHKKALTDKITYYLDNPGEAEKISRRGYHLVRTRHSNVVRARELIRLMEDLI